MQVLVPRPKKSRSKTEKEEQSEVLFITDIVVNDGKKARFDVYILLPGSR